MLSVPNMESMYDRNKNQSKQRGVLRLKHRITDVYMCYKCSRDARVQIKHTYRIDVEKYTN